MAFFECERTSDLESHFPKNRPYGSFRHKTLTLKSNYLAASKKTSGCGPPGCPCQLRECIVLPGYYAAYYRIFKNIAGTAWHTPFISIQQSPNWPRPPDCFLCLPLHSTANAAHGFTIRGTFGVFRTISILKRRLAFFHSKFNMQLAHARKQKYRRFPSSRPSFSVISSSSKR